MREASATPDDLGPATEARFARAFADSAVITRQAAAALLGVDAGTLDSLTTAHVIRAVPRGRRRAYTERDLRDYLLRAPEPIPGPKPGRARVVPRAKSVRFSELSLGPSHRAMR